MARAPWRSQNRELEAGMTDGAYKKVVKDRGGFPEQITAVMRSYMDDVWHGIHEVQPKMTPDGIVTDTEDYFSTKKAEQV